MKHKTYQPEDMEDEGCWFSIDLINDQEEQITFSVINASPKDEGDPGVWADKHLAECRRLAYLGAIYEAEKLTQNLRNEAVAMGIDASHIEVLNARLTAGESLDAVDRAWRQGYFFNHSGEVHAVPSLTAYP